MRKYLVLMIVAVMALPAAAFAQGGPGKGSHGPGKMDYIGELNLSKEQLAQFKDMQRESRKKSVEVKSKIQLKRIDLDEEMQKDKPDQKLLGQLIDDLTALHAQQYKAMLESRVKMMGMLTPEQKRKLSERSLMGMHAPMMGMDDDKHGRGRGREPGPRGGTPPIHPPSGN
jgi:Spy/CpxP family protein refolding chaperone